MYPRLLCCEIANLLLQNVIHVFACSQKKTQPYTCCQTLHFEVSLPISQLTQVIHTSSNSESLVFRTFKWKLNFVPTSSKAIGEHSIKSHVRLSVQKLYPKTWKLAITLPQPVAGGHADHCSLFPHCYHQLV